MRFLSSLVLVAGLCHAADPSPVELLAEPSPAPTLPGRRGDSTTPPDTLRAPLADSMAPVPVAVPKAAPVRTTTLVVPGPTVTRGRTIAFGMDTTGSSRDGRSTWAAVGLTLLLPGSGHRYLGHKGMATVWMTTDLVTWSTLLVAWQMQAMHLEDASGIANRYAAAALPSDPDPALLEIMRDWRSRRPVAGRRDSYDESLLLQGLAPDSRFPEDAAHDWDWGSPEDPENNRHIAQFEDALRGWRTSRIVVTYAAGALLLSRAVAVADILRIRRKSASRAGLRAAVVPGPDGGTAVLSWRF